MKSFLKFAIGFIILLLIIFSILFIFLFLLNIIPLLKIPKNEINFKEFSKSIFFPVLFHSLFNSFIITIAINSFVFLGKQKKLKILCFLFPVVFMGIITYFVFYFIKIDINKLNLARIDDLRLFFTPDSLFNYEFVIKQKFSEDDFEKNIIDKIENQKDKNFVSRLYYKDLNSGDYILKRELYPNEKDRFISILYSIEYFQPITIYFFGKNSIKKDYIEKVVFIEKDNINFYNNIKAEFIEDRFFLNFPERRLEFYKEHFREYNVYESVVAFLFEKVGRLTYIFAERNNIFINTLLFISIIFFIQSFVMFIGFKDYRFISFMINFTFIFLFLTYSYDIMIFITNFFRMFIDNLNIIQIIKISIFIIIGVILNMINFLFLKSGIWEHD